LSCNRHGDAKDGMRGRSEFGIRPNKTPDAQSDRAIAITTRPVGMKCRASIDSPSF